MVIIKQMGYQDAVIEVKKLLEKQVESDHYKLKLKLGKAGTKVSTSMTKEEQIKKLEIMLKDLTLKKKSLDEQKVKLAQVEKEGTVDQEVLDKKKQVLEEQYANVNEATKKAELKLKSLKQ